MKRVIINYLRFFVLVFICTSALFFVSGCVRYVAEHPEKSHEQYIKDKAYCENQASEYARLLPDQASYTDEVNHVRQCMKDLGWEYRFRIGDGGGAVKKKTGE